MNETEWTFWSDIMNALHCAHRLLELNLKGEPIDTNLLENYFVCVNEAIRSTEHKGSLIAIALEEFSECMDYKEFKNSSGL